MTASLRWSQGYRGILLHKLGWFEGIPEWPGVIGVRFNTFSYVHIICVRLSTFLKYVHIGVRFRISFWARFEIYISYRGSLTLAGLYIELIAPCPISQTEDHNFVQSSWRISPVLSWAIIFYGARIWPGVHSINSCPIVHSKVIILHGKRWLCAVDCWKGK